MNQFLLANIGTDLADTAKKTAETFGLDAPHFIAQVISFSIVTFLLYRFAYHPILAMLEERRQRIAESLSNADKIKAELARTEAARVEVLAQANAQANKFIEEARAAAARVQEQETQKAIASAEQIITKAREASLVFSTHYVRLWPPGRLCCLSEISTRTTLTGARTAPVQLADNSPSCATTLT